jgi:hypothetical protein
MTMVDRDPAPALGGDCGAGCVHCTLVVRPPAEERQVVQLSGWSLASASVGHFLVPLSLACAGAMLADGQVGQLIGASVGLGVGMTVAALMARRRGASEEAAWQQP